jgi:glutathione S-transferase
MIKLYGHEISGNSHKARLMLSLLNLEYEWVKVDLLKGEHKLPGYLAMNPFGKVPLLVDGETIVSDAQAILVYLARQYGGEQWLPIEAVPLPEKCAKGQRMRGFIIYLVLRPILISIELRKNQNLFWLC